MSLTGHEKRIFSDFKVFGFSRINNFETSSEELNEKLMTSMKLVEDKFQ